MYFWCTALVQWSISRSREHRPPLLQLQTRDFYRTKQFKTICTNLLSRWTTLSNWMSTPLTPGDNHFHTAGEGTLDKYFIDYREFVQQFLEAQSSCCSSSAGLGKTSWLLNHTASLVWLAMMARSTNSPTKDGGRRRGRKNSRIISGNIWRLQKKKKGSV